MNLKKTLLLAVAQGAFSALFFAQNDAQKPAQIDTATTREVTVSASRFSESRRNVPHQIRTIDRREIERVSPLNAADLLAATGEVFVQKSQGGGGSPVLRGMEGNRVLLVLDGVRMNNAIYRSGHLQNVLRLDPFSMDRAEVVYGPGSLVYGSDALGGVMAFFTKKPRFRSETGRKLGGNVFWQGAFPTIGQVFHVDLEASGKRFSSLTSLSASAMDDVFIGKNRRSVWPADFGKRPFVQGFFEGSTDSMVANSSLNRQRPSNLEALFLLQKFRFQPNESTEHALNFYATTSDDVPRFDRLSEFSGNGNPRFGEWYYGPEKWFLANYQFKNRPKTPRFYEELTVSAAFQAVEESRITRRWNNLNRKTQSENVRVGTLNADFMSRLGPMNRLRYGLELTKNDVRSEAVFFSLTTQVEKPADTRYPSGGSQVSTAGFYATNQVVFSEKWRANFGGRWTWTRLEADFGDDVLGFPFSDGEQKNDAFAANAGLIFLPHKSLKMSALASSGFRNPNIDDMGKVYDSSPGELLVVPPSKLGPERATNFELSVETLGDVPFSVALTGFFIDLNDAIVLKKSTFGGLDSVEYDGVLTPVFSNANAQKARIFGATTRLGWRFSSWLRAEATASWTRGRIVESEKSSPLDHIPPLFGRVAVFAKKNRWDAEANLLFNGEKPISEYRLNAEDNEQYALASGTPAWWTANVRGGFEISKNWRAQAFVDNVFDQFYRVFASGISAPGRTVGAAIRLRF